jgi:hypothetical protein
MQRYLSTKSKILVADNIKLQLNRNITKDEIEYIISYMTTNAQGILKYARNNIQKAQNDTVRAITKEWRIDDTSYKSPLGLDYEDKDPESTDRSDDDIDVHTLLKQKLYTSEYSDKRDVIFEDTSGNSLQQIPPQQQQVVMPQSIGGDFLGVKSLIELVSAINPHALSRHFPQLTLDTRNRSLVDASPGVRTTIQWGRNTNGGFAKGTLNSIKPVRNITQIECGTILLPNINDSAFQEFRQITLFIQEFSEQSCILSDTVRFHFMFDAESIVNDSGSERIRLKSVYSHIAEIGFDPPIATIDTLTISFGSPAERLTFGYDRDTNPTSVSSSNPAVFTCSFNHGIKAGDLVYLEGFDTDNPSTDAVTISHANRVTGHVIQNVTASTFEIASINTTGFVNPRVTTIIFGSQRFFIPLKIRYMGGQVTVHTAEGTV